MSEKNNLAIDKTMESQFEYMIRELGDNPNRNGMIGTPKRAHKAMQFLTRGYREDIHQLINGAIFESTMDGMVIVKDIEFYSLCEHHLLPFFGKCHIGYLPNGKILGLSKFARIVDHFAKRFQAQENLNEQIANCINEVIGAKGVGVILKAKHLCMMMRGVEKQDASMLTSIMLGVFQKDERTRNEFLNLIR